MKIALITTKLPSNESGAQVRNLHMLNYLQKMGDETILICLTDKSINKFDIEYYKKNTFNNSYFIYGENINALQKIFYTLQGKIPYIQRLYDFAKNEELKALLYDVDFIQLEELDAYFAIAKMKFNKNVKLILDAHNVDYIRYKIEMSKKSIFYKLLNPFFNYVFMNKEIEAVRRVDHVITCSVSDKLYFSKIVPANKISIIPNAVDESYFKLQNHYENNSILFMGLLSYVPNNDALKYYFHEIHPLVKKRIPNIRIYILGKNAQRWLINCAKNDKTILLIGYVKDVKEYLSKAAVCIAPIRYGSGTRLKILEYMAAGKAVVSTKKGAEGINAVNGTSIIIADEPKVFAMFIVKLLLEEAFRDKISKNAKSLINKEYSYKNTEKKVIRLYDKITRI